MLPKSSLRRTRENVRLASSAVHFRKVSRQISLAALAKRGRTNSFGNAIQNAELAAWT